MTVREAFIRQNHCASMLFDLERAYDTTWYYSIVRDLHSLGICDRLSSVSLPSSNGERSMSSWVPPCYDHSFKRMESLRSGSVLGVTLRERELQLSINRLLKWPDGNGFKFSSEKSKCPLFQEKGMVSILHSLPQWSRCCSARPQIAWDDLRQKVDIFCAHKWT